DRIEHVQLAAAHARSGVQPDLAEDDDRAAGHVLARVIAHSLDDRESAGVADTEPLPGAAGAEELAACRTVEGRVAEQHRIARVVRRREQDDAPAGHSLADAVVRLPDQLELGTCAEERAEALSGRALEARAN